MKFIKLFEEQTAFDEAKSTFNRPNVSLIKTNRNVYSLTEEGGGVNANGHSYVDLGLPSGTLWAKYNVGATSETAYGDYFMWGSTTPNTASECTWTNAPFNNGSSDYDSTYFNSVKGTVCPNDVLAKEYDTASQIMGGDWRMPTETDFNELLSGTTNEWVTNYKGTGVNGMKFTSKTDTSKYIFIPAADNYDNGSVDNVGKFGLVWSSSLYTSDSLQAWYLDFDSVYCGMAGNYRYNGQSVRGVL